MDISMTKKKVNKALDFAAQLNSVEKIFQALAAIALALTNARFPARFER